MKSGILYTQQKTQFNHGCFYEIRTPNKKIPYSENKYESIKSENKSHLPQINDFAQMMKKDNLKYQNEFASPNVSQCHYSSQDYEMKNIKNSEFMNSIQKTRLNLTQSTPNPSINFRREDQQNNQNDLQMKKKIKIEKLIGSCKNCQKRLQDCNKQIQLLRQDKVQYEEIVYELKSQNTQLLNKLQNVQNQLKLIKNSLQFKKQQNRLVSGVINVQFCEINDNETLGIRQTTKFNEKQSHHSQRNINITDLQQILNDMKRKISHYEKQISQKQTLNNHQFYLLQKLRNQQNQLNLTQTSLLEELQFVLAKNKKLKRQNEEIRNQNEERIRQIILLEEIKANFQKETKQLQQTIKQLHQKVKQFEINKLSNYENFHDMTKQTKQPQSANFMQMIDEDQIFPSSLTQNLNEICQILDRRQRTVHLSISKSVDLKILPSFNNFQQKDKKDFALKQTGINCNNEESLNELQQKQIQIKKLQQELNQAHFFQDEMSQYLKNSKSKLSKLAKQLQILSFQHRSLKNKYQSVKSKQFNRTSSFIDLKKDDHTSHQILSAVSLCFNDKFQL